MANPLWGTLEKSQDDSSTIDDAIAAAISDHDADPTAHLGSGASLAAHKAYDVIDHPAGSVVGDKFERTHVFQTDFAVLGTYWLYGNATTGAGGVYLYTTASSGNASYLEDAPKGWEGVDFSQKMYLRVVAKTVETTNQLILWGVGADNEGDGSKGFGWRVEDNTLYAYHVDTPSGSPVFTKTAVSGYTLTDTHTYEVVYDPDAGTLTFFIDGTQVAQFTSGLPTGVDDPSLMVEIKTNEAAAKHVYIMQYYLSVGY